MSTTNQERQRCVAHADLAHLTQKLGQIIQLAYFVALRPHSAAAIIIAAEITILTEKDCCVEITTTTVDSKGVRNANMAIRRGSPCLIAASHRKNAPPNGPKPKMAIRQRSDDVKLVAGSNKK